MSGNGSLSVAQLLLDAKRLAGRLRDHDESCNRVVSGAQETLKAVGEMKNYKEDIETLNAIANQRPRPQLVLGIQQENRHIRQLQQENKELRAALEEHQNAIELIMSKYRQHMMCLVNSSKLDSNAIRQSKTRMLQDRVDKICEMASVMNQSIQLDDQAQSQDQEVMSRLITENKGLREMLEISWRNGSYTDPLTGPRLATKECQTDLLPVPTPVPAHAEVPGAALPNGIPHTAASENTAAADGDSTVNLVNGGSVPNGVAALPKSEHTSPSKEKPQSCCSHCSQAVSAVGNAVDNENSDSDKPASRPVSAASSTSTTSSDSDTTEEDDEVIFNTIKRVVPKAGAGSSGPSGPSGDDCSSKDICSVQEQVEVMEVANGECVNGDAGGGEGS